MMSRRHEKGKKAGRQGHKKIVGLIYGMTGRQEDRKTGIQGERKTDRQKDRKTGR